MSVYRTPPEVVAIMGAVDTFLRARQVRVSGDRQYYRYHPSEWGKAQPLDAKLQTPSGPIRMGDVKVGDALCNPHGGETTVLEILPQGKRPVYEVEFANGDLVRASDEHLWEVNSSYLGFVRPKLLTTKQISERCLSDKGRRNFYIEVPKPLSMDPKLRKQGAIDPYFMGLILGDGCLRCHSLDFTNIDEETTDAIRGYLSDEYELKSRSEAQHRIALSNPGGRRINRYREAMRKYGLDGLYSHQKFVPEDYLYASVEDRLSLVQGLMDTDGYIDERGYAEFNTSSDRLADHFEWLIESLGGYVWRSLKPTTHLPSHRFNIAFEDSSKLFRLRRQSERGKERIRDVRRYIANVRLVGEEEVQCIRVASEDGLYLTDHCVITHNCLRRQQYMHYQQLGYINAEAVSNDSQRLRLFDKGHILEHRWQKHYFTAMGVLRGRWVCQNPYCLSFDDKGEYHFNEVAFKEGATRVYGKHDKIGVFRPDRCVCGCSDLEYGQVPVVSDELNFGGSADLILDFSGLKMEMLEGVRPSYKHEMLPSSPIVADIKTINDFGYKDLIGAMGSSGGPSLQYRIQVTIYAHLLDLEFGILIYENKNDSSVASFKIERNDEIFNTVKQQSLLMQKMREVKALPPPKPEKDSWECKSCQFKSHCHSQPIWNDTALEEKRQKFYGILFEKEKPKRSSSSRRKSGYSSFR